MINIPIRQHNKLVMYGNMIGAEGKMIDRGEASEEKGLSKEFLKAADDAVSQRFRGKVDAKK